MTLRSIRRVQHGSLFILAAVVTTGLLALGRFTSSLGEPIPPAGPNGAFSSPGPARAHALTAGNSLVCVPTSAHSSGAKGTNWRTDLEVHNAGNVQASYTIALLKRDTDNSSATKVSFTLAPGLAQRYTDVIDSVFHFNGAAALQITVTSGTLVVASDTYNQLGSNPWGLPVGATYGQYGPAMRSDEAITASDQGRLIQLSHDPGLANNFRTNLGLVNATALPITVLVDLYSSSGAALGATVQVPLRGLEYKQLDKVFESVTRQVVSDGYAVVRTTTPGGSFFAYASVIDNRTGDPFLVPVQKVAGGSNPPAPTPTVPGPTATPWLPTPTPTQPASVSADLRLYTPSDWPACVVADYRSTWAPPTTPFVSTSYDTYIYVSVANYASATFTAPLELGVSIDGAPKGLWNWSNPSGLQSGYYTPLSLTYSTHDLTAGPHTVRVVLDPNHKLNLANRAAGDCSATWTWSSIVFAPASATAQGSVLVSEVGLATEGPQVPIDQPMAAVALATSATYTVPTSAHSSGAKGTNWRTDLEVHNAGNVQASYTIALLKRDTDNSSATKVSFTLAPGLAQRYTDVIDSVFHFNGAAALQITVTSGTLVVASDTYNQLGSNPWGLPVGATYGQYGPAMRSDEAITASDQGRLIQLSHDPGLANNFRTNLGLVNATALPITVLVDLYSSSGAALGATVQVPLRGLEYKQLDKVFESVTRQVVSDGYAVVRTTTPGGSFFAYASVIDNRTGDPFLVPVQKVTGGSNPPAPTPTVPGPTATPTPAAGPVITGPGGTSVTLPAGGTTPGAAVTLTAGNGAGLAQGSETLVSTAIQVNVGGEGVSTGSGPYLVRIPVTSTVSDPDKLQLKVRTSVGKVYPVAGAYDAGSRTYTTEVERLWDGWTMAVAADAALRSVASAEAAASALAWVTPDDWQTCDWRAFIHTNAASAAFPGEILQAIKPACEHLRGAQFRSPKLWIDSRYAVKARALHIVSGNASSTSFSQRADEDDVTFSMAHFNDEQMHSLGQLYFNWDEFQGVIKAEGWSDGNVTIHELLHAVQSGYDIRDLWWKNGNAWNHVLMWLMEGTATLVGMNYQTNLSGIYGGEVTVRSHEPPETLDSQVEYWAGTAAYARQDFFAYVAKRYNGGAFRDLRNLFQDMSDQTNGQFGKSPVEYQTLYRRAMDVHYEQAFGVSLPDLYTNFAVDRAYRHTDAAVLRAADRALAKNSLDRTLFFGVTAWDTAAKAQVAVVADGGYSPSGLLPLQTWAITVPVPASAQTAGSLPLAFQVTGAPFGHTGVRIFVFREKSGVMLAGGEIEVTDIAKPVSVPADTNTQSLTILVVNGSVENTPAQVTVGIYSPVSAFALTLPEVVGCGNIDREWGTWGLFVAKWAGSTFSYNENTSKTDANGIRHDNQMTITGAVSADRKALVSFQMDEHWKETYPVSASCPSGCYDEGWKSIKVSNVPAAADSGGALYHFYAEGAAGRGAITSWYHRVVYSGFQYSANFDCTYSLDDAQLAQFKVDFRVAPAP